MSRVQKKPDFDQFTVDELDASISAEAAHSPTLAAAIDDANALQELLDELVSLRKRAELTQTEVARLMGVRQPTVSQFETESSDPRISTLQRYARAVGSRIVVSVSGQTGLFGASQVYTQKAPAARVRSPRIPVNRNQVAYDWAVESPRTDFTLAA